MVAEKQESANGSGFVTNALCKERTKRFDGELEDMKHQVKENKNDIKGLRYLMLTSAISAVFSLLGVIVIIVKSFAI